MSKDELLFEIIRNGMIDLSVVEKGLLMNDRQIYLPKHCYTIYQGKDGSWYTYLPDQSKTTKRRQIKRKTQAEVEDVVISYYKEEEENPTVKEVFDEWQERMIELNKIRLSTYTRYKTDFNRYFVDFQTRRVKSLKPEDISDFLEEQLAKHHLSTRAFSNLKIITRGLLKRAKRRKLIYFNVEAIFQELDVTENEFEKKLKDDSEEIFYDEEFTAIMEYCREHKDDERCLGVALMFIAGLRVGEVVGLKHDDISGDVVSIHRTEMFYKDSDGYHYDIEEYTKTLAGIRRVVVPAKYVWVLDELKNFNTSREFIFYSQRGGRLHTDGIRRKQYEICRKLGIPVRSPHKARKTYGSMLIDGNVSKKIVEKQMGHTDISCTQKYYYRDRYDEQQKRNAINSIPQFE